jgi:hypothetical protein
MLDGVGVVRANLFKEIFEVVCGQLCLTLAAACDRRGVLHARATYLPVDALLSSIAISWHRCLHLFLPPLVHFSTSWVVTSGDGPLMLLWVG